jgi:hypothetical protein
MLVALAPAILDEAKTWARAGRLPSSCPTSWRACLFAGLALVTLELELVFLLSSLNAKRALRVFEKKDPRRSQTRMLHSTN